MLDDTLYLGNKTLCDYCNSKTVKKRHKKEKDTHAAAATPTPIDQHDHSGSGDMVSHVEEHAATDSREGDLKFMNLPSSSIT